MSPITFSFYLALAIIKQIPGAPVSAQETLFSSQNQAAAIPSRPIFEEKFVSINGIEQWITIKGDPSKPIILFLHGGPGSVLSPYADNIYKEWEKDFILVQWDQRGAGRTYGRNAPAELTPEYLQSNPLTLEQVAKDGIVVSEYLIRHLGKQKIILFGTSWGSAVGVTMASKRPDLFYAYVGHSQIVDLSGDERLYDKVHSMALNNSDTASVNKLNAIGKPPFDRAKTVGEFWRIIKKYERETSVPAPGSWFEATDDYNNAKDEQDRGDGDDYSFVNFVGDKKLGVVSIRASINFMKDNTEFNIPVYLIQGEKDLLTPAESTKQYFDHLKAPAKKYILLPNTAHGFNQSVVDAQYRIFRSIKR